jgi:hypothetical protein
LIRHSTKARISAVKVATSSFTPLSSNRLAQHRDAGIDEAGGRISNAPPLGLVARRWRFWYKMPTASRIRTREQ